MAAAPTPERLEAEFIKITPRGFEPAEITRPRGAFRLAVDNRSGFQGELSLRLDRVAGSRQNEVRLPKGQLGWRVLVDLTPGRYVVTEANHPDWTCFINITAQ